MKVLIREEQFKKILNEELFLFNNLSQEEKENVFNIFRDSYVKATGKSWNKQKFYDKANDFLFFGDKIDGFVTVRPISDGSLKLTTGAGNLKNVFDGLSEVISTNKPIWGLMSGKLSIILSKKYGFIIPPKDVTIFLLKIIIPEGQYKINDDGSITFNYDDIGESNKVLVVNKKFLNLVVNKLSSKDVPYHINYYLKSI